MKYVEDYENIPGKEWPVRPYYKRELAEAYAPTISPASALNLLSKWIKLNLALDEAGIPATKAPRKYSPPCRWNLYSDTWEDRRNRDEGLGMSD